MTLLEVSGLVAGYGRVPVLHEVDLTLDEGELLTVVGANGAGKSTVMRAIAGLNRPMSGSIRLAGVDLTGASPSVIGRHGVGHVPENRRVLPLLSVEENLRIGAYVRRRDRGGVAADLTRMFDRFPVLRERRAAYAGTLSGGEQQMLAIAMALMSRPRLLMLDEPSLGLAPIVVAGVFAEITRLKDDGTTILLNEQFANEALRIADRAVVLRLGKVVLDGTARDVAADPRVQAAYLGG